jgi:hypothetical protein
MNKKVQITALHEIFGNGFFIYKDKEYSLNNKCNRDNYNAIQNYFGSNEYNYSHLSMEFIAGKIQKIMISTKNINFRPACAYTYSNQLYTEISSLDVSSPIKFEDVIKFWFQSINN